MMIQGLDFVWGTSTRQVCDNVGWCSQLPVATVFDGIFDSWLCKTHFLQYLENHHKYRTEDEYAR